MCVKKLADQLMANQKAFACAESCTGGMLASACTDLAGSSEWFDRGFVTYSNAAKHEMLGVDLSIINEQGAVSFATVEQMASGVIAHSQANYAVSISGIAGPTGGTKDKPVGTVFFGWANKSGQVISQQKHFLGGRHEVREQSVVFVVRKLLSLLESGF